ncbi:type II secretion system F family protein, partial [Patescibacteria group bacterium]
VKMGEVAGKLTESFKVIASDLEKDDELNRKVKGALMYPIIVISLMVVSSLILIIYVLPSIKEIYGQFDAPIPWPTQILFSITNFVTNNLLAIGIVTALIAFLIFI